jgi:hypothetical protein
MSKNLSVLCAVLVASLIIGSAARVMASPSDNVSGWLWGGSEDSGLVPADGVINGNEAGGGLISMNSADCDSDANGFFDISCGGNNTTTAVINYGVNIPLSDGNLTGLAWSSNLGWISFDAADLAGCPDGNCTARRSGNNLAGWARIMSIKNELAAANSGGWLGFISLDGISIDPSTGQLSGYGWNGENNNDPALSGSNVSNGLGWIDFSEAKIETVNILKVCVNSCSSGVAPLTVFGGLTMGQNDVRNLKACFGTNTNNCNDADVTSQTSWTLDSDPGSVIATPLSANGSNPWQIISSSNMGAAQLTARYTVYSSQFNISVIGCVPNCSLHEQDICDGSTFTGNCGQNCSGTRDCGWREVKP